jgi:osmotically-inducible protein OsmY
MTEDDQLKQDVLDELKWEPSVTAAHIGVTAKNGVVTLSGHVQSYAEKFAAELATSRVKGVKAIAEELDVHLPISFNRPDDEIAAAAIARLNWNVSVPRDAIRVKVEKGWVTLSGHVDWHYQLEEASREIRQLFGVVGVTNDVIIAPTVSKSNLSADITRALSRSWFSSPQDVYVSASEGKITLTGHVNTWHERDVAASIAWAAPGATDVENDIHVN